MVMCKNRTKCKNRTRMKKLFILSLFGLVGCGGPSAPGESAGVKFGDFTIKTIDGCEYIEYDYGIGSQRVYSLTHKGNCSNPYHLKTSKP